MHAVHVADDHKQRCHQKRKAPASLWPGHKQLPRVQVNIEGLKDLSKAHSIKALPCVSLFRPHQGHLLTFPSVPARMKAVKKNIQIALDSDSPFFKLDPNGFAVPVDTDPTPEITAAKEEATKLKAATSGLFNHLMAVSNGCAPPDFFWHLCFAFSASSASRRASRSALRIGPFTAPFSSSAARRAAHSAVSRRTCCDHCAQRSARAPCRTAAPVAAPAQAGPSALDAADAVTGDAAAAKRDFLDRWGADYGYGGRIDELYDQEIGSRLPEGQHYLDYTGSALYCRSAIQAAFDDLQVRPVVLSVANNVFRSC